MGLLDGGLKNIVGGALSSIALPMTLHAEAVRKGANEWEPAAKISVALPVKGFVLEYHERLIDGTIIQRGDKRVLLLASSCSRRPESGDSIETGDGKKYRIVNVQTDPASASYSLQVR